jgi:hypothetical protein
MDVADQADIGRKGDTRFRAPPRQHGARYYQEVYIPPGTRYQSGKAAVPDWGRRGGGQQIELLKPLPLEHYGPPIALPPYELTL